MNIINISSNISFNTPHIIYNLITYIYPIVNTIVRQVMVFFRKDESYNVLLVSLMQEQFGNLTDKTLYNQAMLNPTCKLVL